MRAWWIVVVCLSGLLGWTSVARAQVGSAEPASPTPASPTPPPADATTPPSPPVAAPPTAPPPTPQPAGAGDEYHPDGLRFAIGAGYLLGAQSVETPNVTTARLRLPTGLEFEPLVALTNSNATTDTNGMSATTSTFNLELATLVRYPVLRAGRFDLEVVGAIGYDYTKTSPPGNNNATTTTTFDLDWGFAIQFWITRHWAVSATATSPIVTYTSQDVQTGVNMETNTSTTTYGLVFDPEVALLIHVYN